MGLYEAAATVTLEHIEVIDFVQMEGARPNELVYTKDVYDIPVEEL